MGLENPTLDVTELDVKACGCILKMLIGSFQSTEMMVIVLGIF